MSKLEVLKINKYNNEIKKINLEEAPVDKIQNAVKRLLEGYEVIAFGFHPGLVLYRGIKYKQKPFTYTQLIYPPVEFAKINRASEQGDQFFYCSSSKKAIFYELNCKIGDKLILTTWNNNNYLIFNNIGFSQTSLTNLNSSKIENRIIEPNKENDKIIADVLANCFCKEVLPGNESYYKLCIAIAKIHMNNDEFAGIFYPTIKLNGNEDNFAIKKSVIDANLLDLYKVEFIEITNIVGSQYQYDIIDISYEVLNSDIQWLNSNKIWATNDEAGEIYFSMEENDIKGYNEQGDEIYPD